MSRAPLQRAPSPATHALIGLIAFHAACSRGSAPDLAGTHASAAASTASQAIPARSTSANIGVADVFYLRAAGDPRIAPDGVHVLFTVQYADRTGPPYSRLWIA